MQKAEPQEQKRESLIVKLSPHVGAIGQFFVGFIVACLLAILYFHHSSFDDFAHSAVTTFLIVLGVLGVLIFLGLVYLGFHAYHDGVLKKHERTVASETAKRAALQNQMLEAKVQAAQQLPNLIKYAMDAGHNVEYAGVKVTSYLSNIHALGGPGQPLVLPTAEGYMPDAYKFSDVLQNFTPSKDGILLAKKQDLITVPPGEPLCHTTFTGNTDSGKTNNERLLLIQLLFLGQIVYLCDRSYQRYRQDRKTGAVYDYSPIEKLLAREPVTDTSKAVQLLRHLYSEMEDRRNQRRKALVSFPDIYLFMDELPAFAGEDEEIMVLIGRFLRESRQYGIFFVGAAQDLLNQTLNNDNGAVRDNLLTNYYAGGDSTTARLVLNLAKNERIDETGLGQQGITYLRAKGARIEKIKARTPLADDLATHMLLDDLPAYKIVESKPSYVTQPLREQIAFPMEPLQPKETPSELQKVVEAWNEGYQTLDALIGKTGFTQHKVRVCVSTARAQGLIGEKNHTHTQMEVQA